MTNQEHIDEFKEKVIKTLQEEEWGLLIAAEHAETTIPQLEGLVAKQNAEIDELQAKVDKLQPEHKRELREQRKEAEKRIKELKEQITKNETIMQNIKNHAQKLRYQANEKKNRRKFIEEQFPALLEKDHYANIPQT